jgi:hypothetical protein
VTQSEEFPAEPTPPQQQPVEPTEPIQPTEPTPVQAAYPAPAPMAAAPVPLPAAVLPPSPEELAAAAAKKAKRRMVFAKSAVLALPAVALVGLLVVTSIEASDLSNKTLAASTAAKSATVASGLDVDLHAAQSAAQSSILVDAGCLAAESSTTAQLGNKLFADDKALADASNGTSVTAFMTAATNYLRDVQALSTNLQQDAALSNRSSVKTAIGAFTGDMSHVITDMQDALAGNFGTSVANDFNSVANRLITDGSAVDTLCGGTTLEDGSGSSSTGNSNGSTNA